MSKCLKKQLLVPGLRYFIPRSLGSVAARPECSDTEHVGGEAGLEQNFSAYDGQEAEKQREAEVENKASFKALPSGPFCLRRFFCLQQCLQLWTLEEIKSQSKSELS